MSLQPANTSNDSSLKASVKIFCTHCGAENLAGNTFCHKCGTKIWSADAASQMTLVPEQAVTIPPPPRAPLQTRMAEPHQFNYLEAIVFPFKQKNWLGKMWWLPIVPFFPPFSFFIMRGWRLDLVRRIGKRNPDPLPNFGDIGRFFAEGILLWIMTGIYLLPLAVMLFLTSFSTLATVLEILGWVLERIFTGNNTISFAVLLARIGFDRLFAAAVGGILPLLYVVLSYPFYRIAMIRYALGSNAFVFFDVVGNLRRIPGNAIMLLSLLFMEILTGTLFVTISGFIASSLVGLAIVPFVLAILFPLQYSITGYLFGSLAERMNPVQN